MRVVDRDKVAIVMHYHQYCDDNNTSIDFVVWIYSVHGGLYDQDSNIIVFEEDNDATAFQIKYGI